MTLWYCRACTTAYAVGAPCCPHCGATEYEEEGSVPKITVHGGPTNAGAGVVTEPDAGPTTEAPAEEPAEDAAAAEITAQESAPSVEFGSDPHEPEPEVEEADGAEPAAEESEQPPRPAQSASKADWLAYAQALHPDEDLSTFTKADLIELYGGQG